MRYSVAPRSHFILCGDRDRIRTCDRLLRRQMLYPAELRDLLRNSISISVAVTVPIKVGMRYPAELRDSSRRE